MALFGKHYRATIIIKRTIASSTHLVFAAARSLLTRPSSRDALAPAVHLKEKYFVNGVTFVDV